MKITPKFDEEAVRFDFTLPESAAGKDLRLVAAVSFGGKRIRELRMAVDRARFGCEIDLRSEEAGEWKIRPWHPNHPDLYDVEFVLLSDGREVDRVHSYFGMRKISIENGRILLNNAPLYQRLLLDQVYWPDTHLTPPSEEAILEDIELTLKLGFNGVRKHQKIEDARYLYWCDRKGLLVWSEMGAAYEFHDEAVDRFAREWLDIVRQRYNHPCIVAWVPFNNGRYAFALGYGYRGQPVIVSEYGGIAFKTDAGWGYGNHVRNEEEFLERYRKITAAIKSLP